MLYMTFQYGYEPVLNRIRSHTGNVVAYDDKYNFSTGMNYSAAVACTGFCQGVARSVPENFDTI